MISDSLRSRSAANGTDTGFGGSIHLRARSKMSAYLLHLVRSCRVPQHTIGLSPWSHTPLGWSGKGAMKLLAAGAASLVFR
jgi:hypothetical protein